jgi:TonB family protein
VTLLLALILSTAPDAGTLTAPPLVPMEPMVFGSLDKEVIRKIIHENREQIRACYETALTRKSDLKGKVSVKFTISAEGPVSAAEIVADTPGDHPLAECVANAVKTWTFPKPQGGGVVIVTYPFIFGAK